MTAQTVTEDINWEHVTLRVTAEKKDEWEKYVENHSEAGNLSQFIRTAVRHKMKGQADDPQEPQQAIAHEQISEIADGINDLQTSVNSMEKRLNAIEQDMGVMQGMDVQDAVFNALPTPPKDMDPSDPVKYHEWAATVTEIAEETARPKSEIRQAIERLQEVSGQVQGRSGGPDDQTYYYKRE
jgi:hypothetical protein